MVDDPDTDLIKDPDEHLDADAAQGEDEDGTPTAIAAGGSTKTPESADPTPGAVTTLSRADIPPEGAGVSGRVGEGMFWLMTTNGVDNVKKYDGRSGLSAGGRAKPSVLCIAAI